MGMKFDPITGMFLPQGPTGAAGAAGATGATGAAGSNGTNGVDATLKICYITDVKSSGTDGGSATNGSWQTRVLNTLDDHGTSITIASNQMIVPAGSYHIQVRQPFHGIVNRAITRLYNITDSALILLGSSVCETGGGSTFHSYIEGYFTLAAQKTLEAQYWVQTSLGTTGLGFQATAYGGGPAVTELYTQIKIHKV